MYMRMTQCCTINILVLIENLTIVVGIGRFMCAQSAFNKTNKLLTKCE